MEQELKELRTLLAVTAKQLRMQKESIAAKDAQIAALTEQAAKLTAQTEELYIRRTAITVPSRHPKAWRPLVYFLGLHELPSMIGTPKKVVQEWND